MVDVGGSKTVQIRGMHSDSTDNTKLRSKVLLLVNGRRTGTVHVDQIPVENVERIEIIRGPSAVQYGTSALGGVINVITRKGEKDTFSATLEAGFGSFGLNRESFSFSGGYGPFDFSGSFGYEERDSIKTLYHVKLPHSSAERKFVNLDAGYTFNDIHRIGMSYSHTRKNDEWPMVPFRVYLDMRKSGENLDQDYGNYILSIESAGLTYDGSTDDGTFDWSAFFTKSEYERLGTTRNAYYYEPLNRFSTFQHVTNAGASAGYDGKYLDVDLGFDFTEYKISGSTDGDNVAKDLGIYLSTKIKPMGESFLISLGGRYDKFSFDDNLPGTASMSKTHFSPSLGLSYLPVEWLKLRANYSSGLRVPSAFEYLGDTTGIYRTQPNPDLKPEESNTWEFGLDVDYRFISGSLTYFHTDWKNRIHWEQYPGSQNYLDGWYVNIKDSKISGLEAVFSADLGEAFDLGYQLRPYLNYTYYTKRKNKDEDSINRYDNDDTLPFIPRWTLAYGVTFKHAGIDLLANANAVHMGSIRSVNYLTYEYFTKSSEFVTLDLAVEKGLFEIGTDGKYGKLKLRVEAKNILDSKNETYRDFPGPGRNFYVGLKWVY
ncbi:MAG: TonB-dependent receptor [Deltaproteobacteria bacterium]|jgi:vitamin B12 transporter|nr:TonB-dependent receptor [Deltaproteobacteria bacterium]